MQPSASAQPLTTRPLPAAGGGFARQHSSLSGGGEWATHGSSAAGGGMSSLGGIGGTGRGDGVAVSSLAGSAQQGAVSSSSTSYSSSPFFNSAPSGQSRSVPSSIKRGWEGGAGAGSGEAGEGMGVGGGGEGGGGRGVGGWGRGVPSTPMLQPSSTQKVAASSWGAQAAGKRSCSNSGASARHWR